uniref:hypothetical protein n=1 Tax=Legionella geestiana TaxID=45065 RepID=UPI001A94608D
MALPLSDDACLPEDAALLVVAKKPSRAAEGEATGAGDLSRFEKSVNIQRLLTCVVMPARGS